MAFYNSTYFVYFYWHVLHSSTGSDEYFHLQDPGYWVGHLPVTGDFDGDGRTDHIVGTTGDYPV